MSGITDLLLASMGKGQLQQMASAVGASPELTERAVSAALPALIGGLARNATQSPQGAASLASALDRDHDGSMLDNVGSLLGALSGGKSSGGRGGLGGLLGAAAGSLLGGGRKQQQPPRAANGAGILKHVFGDRQSQVENTVGKASGIDAAQAAQLMAVLAPMVMGALGKVKKQQGLDPAALAGMLSQERDGMVQQSPAVGGLLGMLDQDGDGDIKDDIAGLGAGLLKGFLNRR